MFAKIHSRFLLWKFPIRFPVKNKSGFVYPHAVSASRNWMKSKAGPLLFHFRLYWAIRLSALWISRVRMPQSMLKVCGWVSAGSGHPAGNAAIVLKALKISVLISRRQGAISQGAMRSM